MDGDPSQKGCPIPNLLSSLSVLPQILSLRFAWPQLGERPFFAGHGREGPSFPRDAATIRPQAGWDNEGLCDLSARLGMR